MHVSILNTLISVGKSRRATMTLRKLLMNEVYRLTTSYYSSLPGETGETQ